MNGHYYILFILLSLNQWDIQFTSKQPHSSSIILDYNDWSYNRKLIQVFMTLIQVFNLFRSTQGILFNFFGTAESNLQSSDDAIFIHTYGWSVASMDEKYCIQNYICVFIHNINIITNFHSTCEILPARQINKNFGPLLRLAWNKCLFAPLWNSTH